MRWRALRPVGEPLPPISRDTIEPAGVLPTGYKGHFVQSGTAALALALLTAKARSRNERNRVLLPAYGCPDMVAAIVYAGLVPELVDTAPNEPFLNLELLEKQLDDGVLAVIAAHFLGLAERVEAVQDLAQKVGAWVIEDSAQRLPGSGGIGPVADLVVLSFGRGKPAGALGGGALLVKNDPFEKIHPETWIGPPTRPLLPAGIKRLAYNLAIRPLPYAMATRLPGLALGETRYRPLGSIQALDPARRKVALNTMLHLSGVAPRRACHQLRSALLQLSGLQLVSNHMVTDGCEGLTRLPILFDSRTLRDGAHESLSAAGLGASTMYGKALPDLEGMPYVPRVQRYLPQFARHFADRLLTIPVHSGVHRRHIDGIASLLVRIASFPSAEI